MLLLLLSWIVVLNAAPGKAADKLRVISVQSRHLPESQNPEQCRRWDNRGADCGLMASVWVFLAQPEVPEMLERCNGPLCALLKSICDKSIPGPFTECSQLSLLLGFPSGEPSARCFKDGCYYPLPAMARIMLKLSAESAEIRERFGSVSEPYLPILFGKTTRTMAILTAPFIILQQKNYDYHEYVRGVRKNIFSQAEDQKEVKSVRRQHADVAVWLKDIFKNDELRKGVTMDPKHGNFFTCPKLHTMSLAFKLKYMSKKATHAVFLMAPPDKKTLKSKGKWTTDTDPDTDPEYPGRISLEANRVVEFVPKKAAKDRRYWELYSAALTTRIRVDPENEATELHEFPLWYSHGANPPAGGTICHTWERQWRRKPESFTTDEACNRDALAEAMIFAATDTQTSRRKNNNKQQQRPERKSVLSELVDDVNSTERFAEDGRNAMVESADAGLERKHHG